MKTIRIKRSTLELLKDGDVAVYKDDDIEVWIVDKLSVEEDD